MENNHNDIPSQAKGNKSNPKQNNDTNKRETDPNNPTAKPGKQDGNKQNDGKGHPKNK